MLQKAITVLIILYLRKTGQDASKERWDLLQFTQQNSSKLHASDLWSLSQQERLPTLTKNQRM